MSPSARATRPVRRPTSAALRFFSACAAVISPLPGLRGRATAASGARPTARAAVTTTAAVLIRVPVPRTSLPGEPTTAHTLPRQPHLRQRQLHFAPVTPVTGRQQSGQNGSNGGESSAGEAVEQLAQHLA